MAVSCKAAVQKTSLKENDIYQHPKLTPTTPGRIYHITIAESSLLAQSQLLKAIQSQIPNNNPENGDWIVEGSERQFLWVVRDPNDFFRLLISPRKRQCHQLVGFHLKRLPHDLAPLTVSDQMILRFASACPNLIDVHIDGAQLLSKHAVFGFAAHCPSLRRLCFGAGEPLDDFTRTLNLDLDVYECTSKKGIQISTPHKTSTLKLIQKMGMSKSERDTLKTAIKVRRNAQNTAVDSINGLQNSFSAQQTAQRDQVLNTQPDKAKSESNTGTVMMIQPKDSCFGLISETDVELESGNIEAESEEVESKRLDWDAVVEGLFGT